MSPQHPPANGPRKRRRRAQLSCDLCRTSKLKCDRRVPMCSSCLAHGRSERECTIGGVPLVDINRPSPAVPPAAAETSTGTAPGVKPRTILPTPGPGLPEDFTRTLLALQPRGEHDHHSSRPILFGPVTVNTTPDPWSELAAEARSLLPKKEEQMLQMLRTHRDKIAIVTPWYESASLETHIRVLYALPSTDRGPSGSPAQLYLTCRQGTTLPLLAFLCAVTATVYHLSPPSLLLIWGVVASPSVAGEEAFKLTSVARMCFHESFLQVEKSACPMHNCPLVKLAIQAGLSILTASVSVAIPPGCMGVLDTCIRAARQARMDRLGPVKDLSREARISAAIWAMLVWYDWRAAPYQSCYMVYPGTFTTSWEGVTHASLLNDDKPYAIWALLLKAAEQALHLCELGLHDASERARVQKEQVEEAERAIDAVLQQRGELLSPEIPLEVKDGSTQNMLRTHPYIGIQGIMLTATLRSIKVSLSMPYALVGGLNKGVEEARALIQLGVDCMRSGQILHRTWYFRHAVFNAGLIMVLDLLVRPGGASHMTSAVEVLEDRRRNTAREMPWEEEGSFSGQRLEQLLSLALSRQNQSGDGPSALDQYMQAYSTNLLGRRREQLAQAKAQATPVPEPDIPPLDLAGLWDLGQDPSLALEALLADPFLVGPPLF